MAIIDLKKNRFGIERASKKYDSISNNKGTKINLLDTLTSFKRYNYLSFFKALSKHQAIYGIISKIVNKTFSNGYTLKATTNNPSKLQLRQLEKYLSNIHPDGFTFEEIMMDALADLLACGTKILQIGVEYPYLYDIDFNTLYPRIDENGLFVKDGKGYWVQIINGRPVYYLDKLETLWFRLPIKNGLLPISPLEPVLLTAELDIFSKELNRARFLNSAYYGGVFVIKDGTRAEADELLDYIHEQYKPSYTDFGELDYEKIYSPIVVFGNADFKDYLNDRVKDIDFIQLRLTAIKDVCLVYDVPVRVMGIEEKGLGQSGANDVAIKQYYEDVIIPKQALLEKQINSQLFRDRLNITDWEFSFIRPKWIDAKNEVKIYIDLYNSGLLTIEEARKSLKDYIPTIDLEAKIDPKKAIDKKSKDSNRLANGVNVRKVYKVDSSKYWNMRKVKSDLDYSEASILDRTIQIVDKIINDAIKQYVKLFKDNNLSQTVKLKYKSELLNLFYNEGKKTTDRGAKDIQSQFKKRAVLDSLSKYNKIVKREANRFAQNIAAKIESELDIIFTNAIKRGFNEDRLVADFESFSNKYKKSLPTVVRTITTAFYNYGRQYAIRDNNDIIGSVIYSAVLDDRTSERCQRLDGTVIPINSDLYNSIIPPQHFNCRSIIIPVAKDDEEIETTDRKDIVNILNNTNGFDTI